MEEGGLEDGLQKGHGAGVFLGEPAVEEPQGLGDQAQIEAGHPHIRLGEGHGRGLQGGGEEGPAPVHLPEKVQRKLFQSGEAVPAGQENPDLGPGHDPRDGPEVPDVPHPPPAVHGAAGDGKLPDLPDGGEGLKEVKEPLLLEEGAVAAGALLRRLGQGLPPARLGLLAGAQGRQGEVVQHLLQVAHGEVGVAVPVRQGLPLLREADPPPHAPGREARDGPARGAPTPRRGGPPAVEEVDGKPHLLPHPA